MPVLPFLKSRVFLTIWGFVSVLSAYLGWVLHQERSVLLDQGRSEALSLSWLVAENIDISLRLVDVSLRQAIESLPPASMEQNAVSTGAMRRKIEEHLRRYQDSIPGILSLAVTDQRGMVIAGTAGALVGTELGDRAYFQSLRTGDGDNAVISEAMQGERSGKWGMKISRRIEYPDGRFAGVLVADLGIDKYFASLFESLRLMEGASVSLWNRNRHLLMRYPVTTGESSKAIPLPGSTNSSLPVWMESQPETGAVQDIPGAIKARQTLRNYPIDAVITLNRMDWLSSWRRNLTVTLLMWAALISAAAMLTRQLAQKRRSEEWLRLTASVFTHSHEGIMITDANSRIIDVNRQMEELTGYSRPEMIGKTPAILDSGHHDLKFFSLMKKILQEEDAWRGDIWNRRKDGGLYVQHTRISAVRDDTGAVSHFVGMASDITDVKEALSNLEKMAFHDPLTDLPNRVLLADRLQQAITSNRRDNTLLAVCYLDLDKFKPVNDTYGHAVGDQLLVHVAKRWRGCIRGGDTVARLGGDEFVILLNNLGSILECETAVARLLDAIATPFTHGDIVIEISASIGVAICPRDGTHSEELLNRADLMLYHAKNAGRNCYRLNT